MNIILICVVGLATILVGSCAYLMLIVPSPDAEPTTIPLVDNIIEQPITQPTPIAPEVVAPKVIEDPLPIPESLSTAQRSNILQVPKTGMVAQLISNETWLKELGFPIPVKNATYDEQSYYLRLQCTGYIWNLLTNEWMDENCPNCNENDWGNMRRAFLSNQTLVDEIVVSRL